LLKLRAQSELFSRLGRQKFLEGALKLREGKWLQFPDPKERFQARTPGQEVAVLIEGENSVARAFEKRLQ
jgi:hypothetical protein